MSDSAFSTSGIGGPNFQPRTHRARAILDVVTSIYPNAWVAIDRFRALRGNGLPRWPDWCYCPLSGAYAVVSGGGANRVPFFRSHHIGIIGALAAWRMGQQVIRFDPALYAHLVETPISGDLPVDLLYRLPAWGVYIETPDMTVFGRNMHGVWVHLDWMDGTQHELRLVLDVANTPSSALDADGGLIPIPIILGAGSLEQAIHQVIESGSRQAITEGFQGIDASMMDVPAVARSLAGILSLVLYLCSDEPDWGRDMPRNPEPKRTRRDGWRLFAAQKIQVWEVGVRLGAALRAAFHAAETGQSSIDKETERARPRAHIRRAHWHTFLAGAGRSERKLKWMPPIPVNMNETDHLPAVIRRVDPVRDKPRRSGRGRIARTA